MTWPSHDLTPQQTSRHQNTSLQSTKHHHHGTAEGSFTAKKWFGHRAGRSPCAHSIGKFFLCYIVLFLLETSAPGLSGYYWYLPIYTPSWCPDQCLLMPWPNGLLSSESMICWLSWVAQLVEMGGCGYSQHKKCPVHDFCSWENILRNIIPMSEVTWIYSSSLSTEFSRADHAKEETETCAAQLTDTNSL